MVNLCTVSKLKLMSCPDCSWQGSGSCLLPLPSFQVVVLAPAVLPALKSDHLPLFLDQVLQVRAFGSAACVPTGGLPGCLTCWRHTVGCASVSEDATCFRALPSEQGCYTETQQRGARTEKAHIQIVFLKG